jgi:hypothetical protein
MFQPAPQALSSFVSRPDEPLLWGDPSSDSFSSCFNNRNAPLTQLGDCGVDEGIEFIGHGR